MTWEITNEYKMKQTLEKYVRRIDTQIDTKKIASRTTERTARAWQKLAKRGVAAADNQ